MNRGGRASRQKKMRHGDSERRKTEPWMRSSREDSSLLSWKMPRRLDCDTVPSEGGNWWTMNAVFAGAAAALLIIVGFVVATGVVREESGGRVPANLEVALTVMPVRPPSPRLPRRACLTRGCREASAFLRNTLNEDVDPCRNFGKYVCGGAEAGYDFYREVDAALLDASAATLDAVLVVPRKRQTATQKAAVLFRGCLAERSNADVEALRALLSRYDLAPSDTERPYPAEALLRLAAKYGNGVFFSLSWYVAPGGVKTAVRVERNDAFAVWMDASNQRSDAVRADCVDAIMSVVHDKGDDLRSLREVVLEAEATLQGLWFNATSRSRPRLGRIDDLGAATSRLLVAALNEAAEDSAVYTPDDALEVSDVESTLELMHAAVGSLDAPHLLLYLGFELVRQMGHLVSERLHQASCFGEGLALGSRRSCARLVREVGGLAAHARYLLQLLDSRASRRASSTFRRVKQEFQRRIRAARWLPLRTRKSILTRLNGTRAVVAFPTLMRSEQSLDDYYAGVPDMEGVLFRDVLSWRRTGIARLLRPKALDVLSPNVTYEESGNVVLVPTFLALPPLFSRDGPAAVHYGFLGLRIASALAALAFRTDGDAARTALGRDCDALTARDLTTLLASGVASDAYAKAAESSDDDSEGDLGTLSAPRALFVAACAPYCSEDAASALACNVPLSHLAAFARAFRCDRGSPMRPERQCLAL